MADPYEIKVISSADTAGLEQTAQSGQKVEQQMSAAGEAATKAGEQIATAQKEAAASTTQAAAAQEQLNRQVSQVPDASIKELIQVVGILIDQAASAGVTFDRMEQHLARAGQQGGAALQPVIRNAQEAKEQLTEAEHAAEHFISAIQAGVGIDIGHRIVEAVSELPAKFREALEEGVRFNAEMEQLSVGLAGAFRASDPDRYLNFHAAQTAGTEALEAIRVKANALGLDFHALAEGLSINLHGLEEGGITDIQQQIDLITTLNQAAQAKGLQGNQASRDIIDLLNGRANRTLFGAELGIKDEDVKAAREAGKLYEFLNEKLAAYKEGGQAAAATFAAAEQRLKNETQQLYGEISKPVFEALKVALAEINEQLSSGNMAEQLRGLGYDIAVIAESGATLLRWAIAMAPVLIRVAEGIGAISLAIALLKLPGLIGALGQKSLAWLRSAEAIDTETAALKRNAVAAEEDAVAKVRVPGGRGAAGAGAAAAEAGEGATTRGFLSTTGAGAAIGTGLVALEAGYALIKLIEAAENERIDRMHDQSEADSAAIVATQQQVDLADTAAKKDQARADIKQRIADLDKRIADDEYRQSFAGGPATKQQQEDDDGTTLLRERRRLAQHQLDTFDSRAGKGDEEERRKAAQAKKDAEALAAYEKTAEYELAQARESGDADRIAKAEHRLAVEKEIDRLRTSDHLGEKDAEAQGEHNVAAKELTKETEHLNTLAESVARKAERQQSAAELTTEATAKMADILRQLPPDRAAALGSAPDAGALATAVRALPQGTDAEVESKRTLLKLTAELLALDQARDAAAKRETTQQDKDAKESEEKAKNLKQTQDVIAAEKEQTAILEARGRGQKDAADALEKERDIRLEILRLQNAGVGYEDAKALATDKVNAANAASDEKQEERDDRRRERHEREHHPAHRRGERETFTIHGYSNANQDGGGGLHTGGLQTGGLSTGNLGGGGGSTAADALAAAPSYVPSFPKPPKALYPPGADPLLPLFASGPLGSLFGATATASLGPALGGLNVAQTPPASASQPGGNGGFDATTKAGADVARAARETTSATRALSATLSSLFADQKRELEDQRRELETLKERIGNRS